MAADHYLAKFDAFDTDSGHWEAWARDLSAVNTDMPMPSAWAFGQFMWTQFFMQSYLANLTLFDAFVEEGKVELAGMATKLTAIETTYSTAEADAVAEIGTLAS